MVNVEVNGAWDHRSLELLLLLLVWSDAYRGTED